MVAEIMANCHDQNYGVQLKPITPFSQVQNDSLQNRPAEMVITPAPETLGELYHLLDEFKHTYGANADTVYIPAETEEALKSNLYEPDSLFTVCLADYNVVHDTEEFKLTGNF